MNAYRVRRPALALAFAFAFAAAAPAEASLRVCNRTKTLSTQSGLAALSPRQHNAPLVTEPPCDPGRSAFSTRDARGTKIAQVIELLQRRMSVARPKACATKPSQRSRRSIDLSIKDAAVVLNCAGPFKYTAEPLANACLRAGAAARMHGPEAGMVRTTATALGACAKDAQRRRAGGFRRRPSAPDFVLETEGVTREELV